MLTSLLGAGDAGRENAGYDDAADSQLGSNNLVTFLTLTQNFCIYSALNTIHNTMFIS